MRGCAGGNHGTPRRRDLYRTLILCLNHRSQARAQGDAAHQPVDPNLAAAAAKIRAAKRGRALAVAAAPPRAELATSRTVIPNSHAAARAPHPNQGAGQARRSPNYSDAPVRARKRRSAGQGYVGRRVYRSAYGRIHEGRIVEYELPVEHQKEKFMGQLS